MRLTVGAGNANKDASRPLRVLPVSPARSHPIAWAVSNTGRHECRRSFKALHVFQAFAPFTPAALAAIREIGLFIRQATA